MHKSARACLLGVGELLGEGRNVLGQGQDRGLAILNRRVEGVDVLGRLSLSISCASIARPSTQLHSVATALLPTACLPLGLARLSLGSLCPRTACCG